MRSYYEWKMPLKFVFQYDNDPKNTANLIKE